MAITPVDILHTRFKGALRGYSRHHVDAFVGSVREALEQALSEKAELQRRVESLESELERIRKIESSMTGALTLAQKSADELRANAHRDAEMILREAEQGRVGLVVDAQREAGKLRVEISLLQVTRDRFAAEFRGILSAYTELLDKRVIAASTESVPTAGVQSDRPDEAEADIETAQVA